MSDCIFCKIANGQMGANILWQDDQGLAFADISPQAPTHVLIIPRKHIVSLDQATPEDSSLLGHLQMAAAKIARRVGIAKGYRLVCNNGAQAGQSVFHLHYHLLGGRIMQWPPG